MTNESFGILSDISLSFRPYIQNVLQELKLGLCKTKVDLEKIPGGSDGVDTQFRLVLPYCSKKLKWEVIFDPTTPWFAPDFRFDDESFLTSIDEDTLEEKLESLAKWNENDPKALSKVISELVTLYRIHQIKKLTEDESSRAYFEYTALLGDALTSDNDIEVWVGGHVVEFLIKLNIDVSRLPEIFCDGIEENPGIDTALLLVRYPNSTNAELILSPLLTKTLGNITLPLMHQSGVLMDYVPMVTELINKKINEVLTIEKMRREILVKLIVKYEGAVLEHDSNSASFLFETNDFHWILHIEVGESFPVQLPVMTLRSVYHLDKGKPKYKVLPGCPYYAFEEYISEQAEIFKNECKGTQPNNQLINIEN